MEASGSRLLREIHSSSSFRVPLEQAVEADDVELLDVVIVGISVGHLRIERRDPLSP